MRIKAPQVTEDHGYRRSTVHIVITIDEDLFFPVDSRFDTLDSLFHVAHELWSVQVLERWAEIFLGFVKSGYTALKKNSGQVWIDIDAFAKRFDLRKVGQFLMKPSPIHLTSKLIAPRAPGIPSLPLVPFLPGWPSSVLMPLGLSPAYPPEPPSPPNPRAPP